MSQKTQVHNLIILDESGSMNSIREEVIHVFNALLDNIRDVEKQFPEQEHLVSFYTFNGSGIKKLHYMSPVANMEPIDQSKYQPNNNTPLYDAIGEGVVSLRKSVEGREDCHVRVNIMTDGYENVSVEYTQKQIKDLIEEMKKQGWTFTYSGADHDVEKVAMELSIETKIIFDKSRRGMQNWMAKESASMMSYSLNISDKKKRMAKEDKFGLDTDK
jgi:hypothetical protein